VDTKRVRKLRFTFSCTHSTGSLSERRPLSDSRPLPLPLPTLHPIDPPNWPPNRPPNDLLHVAKCRKHLHDIPCIHFGAASFKFNGLCIRKLNILLVLSQALRSSLCQSVQPFSVCFQFNSLRRNAKKRYFRRMHLWRKPFKFPFHFGLSLSHTLKNAERMSNTKFDSKPLYEFSLSSYIAF